jgi:hypothetical protein
MLNPGLITHLLKHLEGVLMLQLAGKTFENQMS